MVDCKKLVVITAITLNIKIEIRTSIKVKPLLVKLINLNESPQLIQNRFVTQAYGNYYLIELFGPGIYIFRPKKSLATKT